MKKRQKEEKEKNKLLVKNLNKRMFRGFNKIKKLKDIKEFGLNKTLRVFDRKKRRNKSY